jgi:hypothetical protein
MVAGVTMQDEGRSKPAGVVVEAHAGQRYRPASVVEGKVAALEGRRGDVNLDGDEVADVTEVRLPGQQALAALPCQAVHDQERPRSRTRRASDDKR